MWDDLRNCDCEGRPWFLASDFNIIRNDTENVGGVHQAARAKQDFNDLIYDCGLLEIPFEASKFFFV